MKINITILQPMGYAPSLVFLEAAENVVHVLRRAGHETAFRKNRIVPGMINVVFGAHLNLPEPVLFPEGTVIFNTEQLESGSGFVSEAYRTLLEQHFVWDYSEANLRCIAHDRKALFPFTYVPETDRAMGAGPKDYDLVFYGSMNPHRRAVLDALKGCGLRLREVNGLFGPERDRIMQRARAVLNLHYYDTQILQQVRCFHPLGNGVPVISENFPGDSAPDFYCDSLLTPGKRDFVSFAAALLQDETQFSRAAEASLAAFRASQDHPKLAESIAATFADLGPRIAAEPTPRYRKLNLGSGKDYRPGWLNIDILERVRPDLVVDLSQPQTFPIRAQSDFMGEIVLEAGSVERIMANDVLEHVPDLVTLMRNCLDLLNDGGVFSVLVPYDLSLGAWQDPTHLRAFNQNSWLYYTDWAWYLGWSDARFELTHTEYRLSALGQQLNGQGVDLNTILNTPRAVDSMQVTLTKRPMTPAEKTQRRVYAQDWMDDA